MASEALGEADKNSASPAPSDKAAVANGNSLNDQQTHVSDTRAGATQQYQSNTGEMEAASQGPPKQKTNANLCGVCESNPGKYKCSRCRLP
jgi:hypothetical protein